MAGIASHFIVDMWTSNVVSKVLDGANDEANSKSKKGYASPFSVTQSKQEESDLSLVGPTLWAPEWINYYSDPIRSESSSDLVASVVTKRRANNFTTNGRPAAAILYQELTKMNVDAHRLVEPYDYGEQLGPAEHFSQPFKIDVHPQVGFLTDIHGHLSDAEVIGLLAGKWDAENKRLYIQAPFPCAATERHEDFGFTDVELDPEAEWKVRQSIAALGLEVVGWYHSHPKFKPNPSVMDIFNQQQYQLYTRDENTGEEPFVGLIVSTYDAQLSSPASDHQWFTVVPYAPPPRKNSIIDQEDLGDEQPRNGGGRGKEEKQDVVHLPVRMSVTYRSVHLDAAFNASSPNSSINSGFMDSASTYSAPLLKSLMALQLQEASVSAKSASGSSSSRQASSIKTEDDGREPAAPSKRKYTPRGSKALLSSAQPEVAPATLSAQTLEEHNNPLPNSITPSTAVKQSAKKGHSKVATNSLQGSSSLEEGEIRERSEAVSTSASSNSLLIEPTTVVSDEEAGEDNSYWRAPPTPSSVPEITPSTSTGAITAIMGMKLDSTTPVPEEAIPEIHVTEEPKITTSPSITMAEQLFDAELARRLGAEEEARGGRARRATRDTKKNDKYGDFVDTLEVTKNLRKQNMDLVKATELKLKQKAAADRAKLKAPVMSVVPVMKDEPLASTTNTNKKQKVSVAAETQDSKSKGKGKGKKTSNDTCDDCVPGFNPLDSTVCGPVVSKKKALPAEKETDSVYTSVILALQDLERPSAALAREVLCSVIPTYRGLALLVISMGFYYARSPRRVDLSKNWKGLARIEKIKASAAVWLQRLGISPDTVAGSTTNTSSPRSDSSSGAATGEAECGDIQDGDTSKDSTGLNTRNSSSGKLSVEQISFRLTEWVGKFLTACWDDYSKNRKRKA